MITVVQNQVMIEKALQLMSNFYNDLIMWTKNPISRYMIKRRINQETFHTITHHIVPATKTGHYNTKFGNDIISRNAPVIMIFHASEGPEENEAVKLSLLFSSIPNLNIKE